jgi:hypothetical protein
MIHENTVSIAYPLAQTLRERGLQVTPLPQTPLASLVAAGVYPEPTKGYEGDLTIGGLIVRGSLLKDQFGVCQHDLVMDEVSDVIAESVKNNLSLAKDVVNPIVKKVLADVEEREKALAITTPTQIEILPVNYQPIWNSPVLTEMVARYQEIEPKAVQLTLSVPYDTSRAALLELAKTGASRFDQEISELFDSVSDEELKQVYTLVFSSGPGEKQARLLSDVVNVSDITNLHNRQAVPILIHLWARKLLQEPPEGVADGIGAYRSYLADIVSQSGRAITAALRRRENAAQSKQLVGAWPAGLDQLGLKPITIYVNGDVYTNWLEAGGEPDAILGSFITNQERGYTALLEGKDGYARDWARQYRILSTTQRQDRINTTINSLRQAMAGVINTLESDALIVPRETLHRQLEVVLGKLSGHFYNDLYVCVRKVVCETLFPHTLSLKILSAIDRVAEEYPNIEVREAALLATIEVVSLWIAKLCRVEYLNIKGA